MSDVLDMVVPQDEQEEIKEFVSTLLLIPKEDRAILLANANAFKVRRDIERARKWGIEWKNHIHLKKMEKHILCEIQ